MATGDGGIKYVKHKAYLTPLAKQQSSGHTCCHSVLLCKVQGETSD